MLSGLHPQKSLMQDKKNNKKKSAIVTMGFQEVLIVYRGMMTS